MEKGFRVPYLNVGIESKRVERASRSRKRVPPLPQIDHCNATSVGACVGVRNSVELLGVSDSRSLVAVVNEVPRLQLIPIVPVAVGIWEATESSAICTSINEDNMKRFINGELLDSQSLSPVDVEVEVGDEFESFDRKVAAHGKDEVELDEIENFVDEDFITEAEEAKKVWDKGGLSFYSSDEEEVLNRLANRKLVCKKRGS
ncbi:hypothetical protein PIB30_076623 [Stylosanthes scabra]|uniref:Uncharacterized protein n=1 Tax=Stylosanthes scabra TaxID=79078 RepID=A0ABU6US47_9FABA|nr:hypothetical protein [Stylosanthes scabra]